ncbi:hypothetical protein [Diaphorobacter sp.]|uniref:hypothetical protein n=1 Tax=Diaphorobacter sp. TaxID=1934310 RepID=UPI003D0E5846
MVRTKTAATLVLALALSACATQWRHPSYSSTPALHEQRLAIDKGYCQQVAHGAAPMPQVAIPSTAPSGYNVSGSGTTYGSRGITRTDYDATVTPVASPAQSFAGGFAQGAAVGTMLRVQREQQAIHKGCMARLGWVAQ